MAAAASSSNCNSVARLPFPTKEAIPEDKQDVSSGIGDSEAMKLELQDPSVVKREPVDMNVKEEQWEDPFGYLRRILKKMNTDKEPEVTIEVKREADKDVRKESEENPFDFLDSKEHQEKFKKYEADFKHDMMNTYFSGKTLFGGNIYDVKVDLDGQTIKSSGLPPYQSYLDPATYLELLNGTEGGSTETSAGGGSSNSPKPPPPSN